jgi:hypothetical protein
MSGVVFAEKSAAPAAKVKTGGRAPFGKLRIGEPNDAYEREADRVAEEVMAGGRRMLNWSLSKMSIASPLQRKCPCGGSGGASDVCEECKKKEEQTLQRNAAGPTDADIAPPIVHDVLNTPGQPLDKATRDFFEPRFRHDFSRVRVHTDARAAESAQAVNAEAYTVGGEMVFADRKFAPYTSEGRSLIAHELTHVLQQGTISPCQRIIDNPSTESETGRNAEAVGAMGWETDHQSANRVGLQRQAQVVGSGAGLDADDQKIVDVAKREVSNFKCNVEFVLWKILSKHFPDDTRKVAGTACEDALPGLRTEFAPTDPKNPKVSRSVPIIYAGKAFLASTDAAGIKDRVADVAEQIKAIDDWRLANFLIEEKDLSNPRISGQLRSMSAGQLIDYKNKSKDREVTRYAENLLTFSTPTQARAAVDPLTGYMTLRVGVVNVVVKPDISGAAGVKGGATIPKFELSPPKSPEYEVDKEGKVFGFTGYSPAAMLTIVTSYGPGSPPEGSSGYGRGTTPEDIRNKATALRFHEGSHGEDYINFVQQNPLPVFKGMNGMKKADYVAAEKAFWAAVTDWGKRLDRVSKSQTDCVGKTIDEFHKGEVGYTKICP